jgi:hypothetical protein
MSNSIINGDGLVNALADQNYQDGLLNNQFKGELFARGYVVSECEVLAPENWVRGEFGKFFFAHDPRLNFCKLDCNNTELIYFGVISDVRDAMLSRLEVCQNLSIAIDESTEKFEDELSFTCGRYVIFWKSDGQYWVTTDATGMRCAYYTTQNIRVISSHIRLLSWNMPGAVFSPKIPMKFGYPGVGTPVKNTRYLTPNTKLNLSNRSVVRYWPCKSIEGIDLRGAIEKSAAYLQGAMDHYATFYKPLISVTAGLDSRLSLALSKNILNGEYFTYYRNDSLETDVHDLAFANIISNVFGRSVDVFELSKLNGAPEDFSNIQKINTIYDHLKKLSWIYYEKYSSRSEIIHVRSNISEVGREFYKGKNFDVNNGVDLARIYLQGDKDYKARYIFNIIERFEEFERVTGITKCKDNVDIKSLFYWEFRMASWHSSVVLESDPAFETVSVYNCRKTLETLLSVSKEERLKSSILRHIIDNKWPELSSFEVNGEPFWRE